MPKGMLAKNLCIGDCGAVVLAYSGGTSNLCGREKCRERVENLLRDGLKTMRAKTLAEAPEPMRIKLLAAAINHLITERSPQQPSVA